MQKMIWIKPPGQRFSSRRTASRRARMPWTILRTMSFKATLHTSTCEPDQYRQALGIGDRRETYTVGKSMLTITATETQVRTCDARLRWSCHSRKIARNFARRRSGNGSSIPTSSTAYRSMKIRARPRSSGFGAVPGGCLAVKTGLFFLSRESSATDRQATSGRVPSSPTRSGSPSRINWPSSRVLPVSLNSNR